MANSEWAVICKQEATQSGKSVVAPFSSPEQATDWIREDCDTNDGERDAYEIVPFFAAE